MPHDPEPDEDDLDDLPDTHPPQPVRYAEQALLGALLLDPHRLGDVSGIAADSFSTDAHAALFAAISTLPPPDPAEHAKNTTCLDHVLATGREKARGLTASYLHTLIFALTGCPATSTSTSRTRCAPWSLTPSHLHDHRTRRGDDARPGPVSLLLPRRSKGAAGQSGESR